MKRTTRRRRSNSSATKKRTVQALAAGAAIAAGTQAYADPIRFDNPLPNEIGHFTWQPAPGGSRFLDLLLDASEQTGLSGGVTRFAQGLSAGEDYGQVGGRPAAAIQVGGFEDYLLVGVDADAEIPSGSAWRQSGLTYLPGYGSELAEGQRTYLGVRFDQGLGNQYGWIGVVRTGMSLDAFAWGYETELGKPVPAGAPEPGTLSALAFGAAFAGLARRRS